MISFRSINSKPQIDISYSCFNQIKLNRIKPSDNMDSVEPSNEQPNNMDSVEPSNEQPNNDDEVSQQSSRGLSFLVLPYEIRQMIYRNLLVAEEPISDLETDRRLDVGLNTAITQTCRKIYLESQSVLYGENVLQLSIGRFITLFEDIEEECSHNLEYQIPFLRHRLLLTKKFEIDFGSGPRDLEETGSFIAAARTACRLLAEIDDLRYLSLELGWMWTHSMRLKIVSAFELLRNVGRVHVTGIEQKDILYINQIVTRSSPVPKMYFALEKYATREHCCKQLLIVAYNAARMDDLKSFKDVRTKIIAEVDRRMAHAKDHLLDHDPDPNLPFPKIPISDQMRQVEGKMNSGQYSDALDLLRGLSDNLVFGDDGFQFSL